MADVQVQRPPEPQTATAASKLAPEPNSARPRSRLDLDTSMVPVSQNGCFEEDRVLKSGHLLRRTRKTKAWKPIYLVLRPSRLSIYKSDKEDKLRHQLYLSDLTAVAFLKDPKHKRQNVFGLFSPSRNFHLEAPTAQEAEAWVDILRQEARIEEEEEEMFLASPTAKRNIPTGLTAISSNRATHIDHEAALSSSPEPMGMPMPPSATGNNGRRKSSQIESSGWSGTDVISDLSDNDMVRGLPGTSYESLSMSPQEPRSIPGTAAASRPQPGDMSRSLSHMSINNIEKDPDRVIWQGWLYHLRTKGGVKQWKHLWGVLRPRNLILYKDQAEYTAQRIIRLSAIVNVVDIDALSKSKANCLQIITEEKSYRFATHDEEALVQCIGAFKSLLAKRRELEARAASKEQVQSQQPQPQQPQPPPPQQQPVQAQR